MNSNPSFVILPATLGDLNPMRVIEKACFPLDGWPLLEQIGALILPNLVKIKAEMDGRMVGFVGGDPHRIQGVGWITTLGVLPQYQRLGIATALLDRCEKEMGLPYVRLTVRRSNINAQSLYFSRGYRQIDVSRNYYEGGEDGLVLQKSL